MQVTVTGVLTSANNIPAMAGRKQLIIRNTGANTVFYGWEKEISADAGSTQGVPLKADETISLMGKERDLGDSLKLICASGQTTTVNFTQRG